MKKEKANKEMTTQPNIQKLPKWAQDYISTLERHKTEAQNELRSVLDAQTETRVWIRRSALNRHDKQYIQEDELHFVLPQGTIQVSINGKELRCIASYYTGDLVVVPDCSNVVSLRFQERTPQ